MNVLVCNDHKEPLDSLIAVLENDSAVGSRTSSASIISPTERSWLSCRTPTGKFLISPERSQMNPPHFVLLSEATSVDDFVDDPVFTDVTKDGEGIAVAFLRIRNRIIEDSRIKTHSGDTGAS